MEGSPAYDAHVRFEHVRMHFGERTVFDDLTCGFPRGQISVLLGGSGSGKSTLLRLLGGLIRPEAGRIFVGDEEVTGASEAALYSVRSRIGMLFQGGALLDSLTIFDNLALPLREHSRPAGRRDRDRGPRPALVGGSRKDRSPAPGAAVRRHAEACGARPGDPPGARDPPMRRALLWAGPGLGEADRDASREDQSGARITVLVISHHIASTLRLADHALLLLPGRSVEGKPADLRRSEDQEVADFFDEDLAIDDVTLAPSETIQP